MREFARYFLLAVVACCFCWRGYAQEDYSRYMGQQSYRQSRTRVEMGTMVGASYMMSQGGAIELAPRLGIRGALSMSLVWNNDYALQMELAYLHNKIEASAGSESFDVKSGVMEIPLLFSYRGLGPVRVNVGPVLSLAGTARYEVGAERVEFGRMRSTLGYAAGVGVELTKHLLIDAHFTANFSEPINYFEGREFYTTNHWVVLSLGYMF